MCYYNLNLICQAIILILYFSSKCQSSAYKVIDSVCKCLENSSQLVQKTVHQLLKLIENLASHSISTSELKKIFLLLRDKEEPVSCFKYFTYLHYFFLNFYSFHTSLKYLGHYQKLPIAHMITAVKYFLIFKKMKVHYSI